MIRFVFRRRAVQEACELAGVWGARFQEGYAAVLTLLASTPEIGPPCPRPKYPTLRHRLVRGCKCYVFYTYDSTKKLITVLSIWDNRRGTGPF
jgi:plasmid stabilization system protein ParE